MSTRFLTPARSKYSLCAANHRAGYFGNLACDWLSIVWAYYEQWRGKEIHWMTSPWNLFTSGCEVGIVRSLHLSAHQWHQFISNVRIIPFQKYESYFKASWNYRVEMKTKFNEKHTAGDMKLNINTNHSLSLATGIFVVDLTIVIFHYFYLSILFLSFLSIFCFAKHELEGAICLTDYF